jgi:hypothetical protein
MIKNNNYKYKYQKYSNKNKNMDGGLFCNPLIPEENILAVGEEGNTEINVAKKKKSALENLKKKYDSILFYGINCTFDRYLQERYKYFKSA